MKYIKDRFYNSRKTSPSLGAPAQDPFNLWRANCFFLRVVSAKVRQVFETTKYLEKFFLPIDFCLLKARIKQASNQPGKQASKLALLASRSAVVVTNLQSYIGHFRPPFLWSCECKGTTTFWIHQIFGEVFFREPHPCVWHLLYIGVPRSHLRRHLLYTGVPRSHLRGHLLYIVSVRTWDLDKEADKQLSSRQNLLTTQGSPDTSEDPFFWVASAKVIQLPESTKLSTNFFSRMSDHPLN